MVSYNTRRQRQVELYTKIPKSNNDTVEPLSSKTTLEFNRTHNTWIAEVLEDKWTELRRSSVYFRLRPRSTMFGEEEINQLHWRC